MLSDDDDDFEDEDDDEDGDGFEDDVVRRPFNCPFSQAL
jgi:hypothetical protein